MPSGNGVVPAGALHLRLLLLLVAACGQHPRLELAGPDGQPAAVQRIVLVTNRVLSPDPSHLGMRARR